ncbi:MAG: hypothetical protein AB3N19_17110 [Ruegeria sp.]
MKRSIRNALLIRSALSFVLNLVLALPITFLIGGINWFFTFAIVFLILTFGPIAFNSKTAIVTAILNLAGHKKLRNSILVDVQRAKMPTGENYSHTDADVYLEQVAMSKTATLGQRLKAVEYSSTLAAFRQTEWVFAIFLSSALNDAIHDHFQRNPPKDGAQPSGV